MNYFLPLALKAFQRRFKILEFDIFDLAFAMPMVVAMRVIESENPSVVARIDRVIDPGQVIARHHGFAQ